MAFLSFKKLFIYLSRKTAVQITTRSSAIAEITSVDGRYVVQGHSKSQTLVPIESPYATSFSE